MYIRYYMADRPEITITFAQSIDGCIATRTGDSRWISSDETLRLAHELRAEADAVLVGAGTIRSDNPRLTCRISGCVSPRRVVLDGRLSIPSDSLVITTAAETPTWVISSDSACAQQEHKLTQLREKGVQILRLSGKPDRETELSLEDVLEALGREGVERLLIEGGSGVITGFLQQRLFDRVVLVTAPLVIGDGVASVGDMGVRQLSTALRLRPGTPRLLGSDLVWELYRE